LRQPRRLSQAAVAGGALRATAAAGYWSEREQYDQLEIIDVGGDHCGLRITSAFERRHPARRLS